MNFLLCDANSWVQHGLAVSTSRTFLNVPKGPVSCHSPDVAAVWFIDTRSWIIRWYVHRKAWTSLPIVTFLLTSLNSTLLNSTGWRGFPRLVISFSGDISFLTCIQVSVMWVATLKNSAVRHLLSSTDTYIYLLFFVLDPPGCWNKHTVPLCYILCLFEGIKHVYGIIPSVMVATLSLLFCVK